MEPLNEITLIICGIVRNAETGLKRNLPIIDALCEKVKDYHIIVYENDSLDKTKSILETWQLKDPSRIHISINDMNSTETIPKVKNTIVNPFFSRKRISKMADLRNKYMDYIDSQDWQADYLIVVDLDVAQLYLEGIISSLISDVEWDAVTANGYSRSPKLHRRYHDTYALAMWGDQDNPQTEDKIKKLAEKLGKLKVSDDWVRIASGFGGLAIYRFEAIKGLRYVALPNQDARVEVKCEHFSIYSQMIERGFRRFYINPAMVLQYQSLNLHLIWNSFKRMCGC